VSDSKYLSCHTLKLGDRKVITWLTRDGYSIIEWHRKTSWRTKKVTSVKLTLEAARATAACLLADFEHGKRTLEKKLEGRNERAENN